MQIVWKFVFGATMIYVAWWLVLSIRQRIVYEVEMALGVGSLWTAGFAPLFFGELPNLVDWPPVFSLIGWAIFCLSIVLFVAAIRSLHRGGRPTSGWEQTTELTTSGIHGLVRHPMQLSGILGACAVVAFSPTLVTFILGGLSVICFALAARAEDRFNVAKLGESYRIYMGQVPAFNLLAGAWAWLRARKQ